MEKIIEKIKNEVEESKEKDFLKIVLKGDSNLKEKREELLEAIKNIATNNFFVLRLSGYTGFIFYFFLNKEGKTLESVSLENLISQEEKHVHKIEINGC
jgi:ERCC4-type nuclease